MAGIDSGFYYIRNLDSGKYIGRLLSEDHSLLPKQIVNLPDRFTGQSRFFFEKFWGDEYKVSINDGRVIAIEDRLFAALLPEPYPEQRWKLVRDERTGWNHFVIIDPEQGFDKAWKDDNEEVFAQVNVGFLPVGRSLPPFYPPNGVWVLERADD